MAKKKTIKKYSPKDSYSELSKADIQRLRQELKPEQRERIKEFEKAEFVTKESRKLETREKELELKSTLRQIPVIGGRLAKISVKEKPIIIKTKQLPTKVRFGENITKQQRFLQELFNDKQTLGQGINLPRMHGALMPNVIFGDEEEYDNTSDSFGFGKKTRTGAMFGI
jgi:hypothetical protein